MKDFRDVVLLHGWGSNAAVWNDMAGRLAPPQRLHVPDLPGYGSTSACAPYSLDGIAAAVARDAPPRCHAVGWSLGGQVALAWARSSPQQVERLALIAATPCFAQRPDWPHAVEGKVLTEFSEAIAADRTGTLERFVSLQAQGDDNDRQVARKLRSGLAAAGETGVAALAGGLQILLEADLRDSLSSIRQPTLVIQGDRDALVPLAGGEYLSRRLPAARLLVLHGAAHAPFLSKPREVAAALRAFLVAVLDE